MKISDFPLTTIDGKAFDWASVAGKKLLIVNTASECGYTFHYEPLEALYQTYKDQNFCVIGIPCNDFGAQEPGTEHEIASFCQKNYGVTFPMMSKVTILGEDAHPLYKWLTSETDTTVLWNFQKYLIDESGNVVRSVEHRMLPDDESIVSWIKGE